MERYTRPYACSALTAKEEALKLSFAPIAFQSTYALLKLGILETIGNHGEQGASAAYIAAELNLSQYGVQVLLDVGLSLRLFWQNDSCYVLDKIGYFVLCDRMVHINTDFVQDVCYQGLTELITAVQTGKPEGLKIFGSWQNIYQGLNQLPPRARNSWLQFDHYYSDKSFPALLPYVFATPVDQLFDIGGNTGKWARQCLHYDSRVNITLIDLPEQIALFARQREGILTSPRLRTWGVDLLANNARLPEGADAIFMSQFLDCFAPEQISHILAKVAKIMTARTRLFIVELFWDRQATEAAAFSINCTSVYFTCMANGNSRMYHSREMIRLIEQAGLWIDRDIDHIGAGHTLLQCRLA